MMLRRSVARLLPRSTRGKVTAVSSGDDVAVVSPEKVRNVGIMAHIDAGKTTTTERMLFYAGSIQRPGEVHHGDTVTDFLPQERERGITIQSAVVSFPWNSTNINLIDTPGHVDFTFEVQRSLRVVDSAVAIIDASAGVEAQTLTVWRQATEYQLPRLIFLNKMDKASASLKDSLESIESKLKYVPLLLQLPFYKDSRKPTGSGICGVVDLVEMKRLVFDESTKGRNVVVDDMSEDKAVRKKRCELVERVADLDSVLLNTILESESTESVSSAHLQAAIKRVTMSAHAAPTLLGSSFKYVGVQPLLDAIVRYLPHPKEAAVVDPVIAAYGSELCLFAFKTIHDPQLGMLTFIRVFGGKLSTGQKMYNVTRKKQEKVLKMYVPFADDLKEISSASDGEVVIVSGLKETITGDTLTVSSSVSSIIGKKIGRKLGSITSVEPILSGVHIPEPVYFCSIEPASLSQQKALDSALECLQKEDPSLHVRTDPDTAQTVLSGMGELHLDIIHERIKSDFKVDADLGKLQVAYKETITSPVKKRITFERKLADQKHHVTIELELVPKTSTGGPVKLYRGPDKDKQENLQHVTERLLRSISNGVESASRNGPKLGFPIINVETILHWFGTTRHTSEAVVEAATATCVRQCLDEINVALLEPVVSLEITVDERYQSAVLDDLNRRRFILESIDFRYGNNVISGTAPLGELTGYSTILRTVSSGLATFSMQFSHYRVVSNPVEFDKIVTEVRGF